VRGTMEFDFRLSDREAKRARPNKNSLRNGLAGLICTFLVAGIYTKSTAVPAAALDPRIISFNAQPVGSSGELHEVRLINTGRVPLQIQRLALTGQDAASFKLPDDSCAGLTLSPGGNCRVRISSRPIRVGILEAQLEFADDAADAPQLVNLQGQGIGRGDLDVRPVDVEFGDGWVGEQSSARTIKLKNIGSSQVRVRSINWFGGQTSGFHKDTDCDAVALEPNVECSFNVTFTPEQAGQGSARLLINDSTGDKDHVVDLAGTGVLRVAVGKWDPPQLEFGREEEGAKGAVQNATLTNAGTATLNLAEGTIQGSHLGDFTLLADDCSRKSLAPEGTCGVRVLFNPRDAAVHDALLTFPANTSIAKVSLSMVGTVVAAKKPGVTLIPTQLDFERQERGKKSAPKIVEIVSTGSELLRLNALRIIGPDNQSFAIAQDSCNGKSLPTKMRCQVRIVFAPKAPLFALKRTPKKESATLMIYDNATGGQQSVALGGESYSREPARSSLTASPMQVDFAQQQLGRQSEPRIVVVTNQGEAPVELSQSRLADISLAGAFLGANSGNFKIIQNGCQAGTLNKGAHCQISLALQPVTVGQLRANLTISDTSGTPPLTVSLSGQGIAQQGWCCLGSNELVSIDAVTCSKRKGKFYLDSAQAHQECRSVVSILRPSSGTSGSSSCATIASLWWKD